MRIQRLQIKNFRNFKDLDIALGAHAVIVGPNGVGKSNLLHALRLVLDPSLPEAARQLRSEDFWDGVSRPIPSTSRIEISVEISEFDESDEQIASLADHLIASDPLVARLTYICRPKARTAPTSASAELEFLLYGGGKEENRISHEVRRRLPLDFFPALRDAEGDLTIWRRSPLRPLLERAWATVSDADKRMIFDVTSSASQALVKTEPLAALRTHIDDALARRAGAETSDVQLSIGAKEAESMIRVVRLMLDNGRRGIGETSLGLANLLFFTLKFIDLETLVANHERDHSFVAIEEPEAHLHPQLQRQLFRSLLRLRAYLATDETSDADTLPATLLVTTHSPHIASVAPLRDIVLLRREADDQTAVHSTAGASAVGIPLEPSDVADLERYIEVTRAELFFARGVLLVEGDAERYLIPKIADLLGLHLDAVGVSVCAVGGTHFEAYSRLLRHLSIPFAVVTDGDPDNDWTGKDRVIGLLEQELGKDAVSTIPESARLLRARKMGFFVGETTLETDLLKAGQERLFCTALLDLGTTKASRLRARGWLAKPSTIDSKQLLKDVVQIGKGRFAQHLASKMDAVSKAEVPKYVYDAISFVTDAVKQ